MDYHSIHGHDVSSFDLSSTHRLPTVSAAQALEDLDDGPSRYLSTGLGALDNALRDVASIGEEEIPSVGGIMRGQVTEVWGPPGAGKTALAMQLAANTLRDNKGVVWVDGFHPLCVRRLSEFITRTPSRNSTVEVEGLDNLVHYTCPTLPHFLALLCRPLPSCLPTLTSLVVIDSLSALLNHAFPRSVDPKGANKNGSKAPSVATRRLQVLQYIINALQKLAATQDIAIVILTQCATRMQAEGGATLIPAINTSSWEQGAFTRLILFKNWIWQADQASSVHCAAVQKLYGKTSPERTDGLVAFTISADALVSVQYDRSQSTPMLAGATPARKRKLKDAGFEVVDSDDGGGEDYGWQDEDEHALPGMPPQWQGSEDLLLGTQRESEDEDENEPAEDDEPLTANYDDDD